MMHMEFEKLKPLMPRVALNTTATREHIEESKGYIQYSALQETTKDNSNRVTTLLCNVNELISREVWHLRKMDPTGFGVPHQAGR